MKKLAALLILGFAGAASAQANLRCSDGTDPQLVSCNSSGHIKTVSGGTGTSSDKVQGAAADATAVASAGNPVLVAGQDGTNSQSLKTDSTGRLEAIGGAADGAAVAGNPVLVAGQDGTNAQSLKTDSTGRLEMAPGGLSTWTQTEVLVLNSAATSVPTTAQTNRKALTIQNLGPNSIFCTPGGTPVVNKAHQIEPDTSWYIEAGASVDVKCIAATADQVTTNATIVTEVN